MEETVALGARTRGAKPLAAVGIWAVSVVRGVQFSGVERTCLQLCSTPNMAITRNMSSSPASAHNTASSRTCMHSSYHS
ncbi:unnamed protein product [Ectocarpus sp. CCAP 1310/34]|nr:unnamed protein product [Ectocarpus sp. CCAP 1310/34]